MHQIQKTASANGEREFEVHAEFSPARLVAIANARHLRLTKVGAFVGHSHAEVDNVFLLHKGALAATIAVPLARASMSNWRTCAPAND